MSFSSEPTLLSLADELLLVVIDQIDNRADLCSLARTCSRFQALVEPFIYKTIFVRTGENARELNNALMTRLERLPYVQDLAIRYIYNDEEGIEYLDRFIGYMDRLRNLHVESPCPNNQPWRNHPEISWMSQCRIDYAPLFGLPGILESGSLPLQMLQSLTLHTHGYEEDLFSFKDRAFVFLHRTLRKFTLSCADLTDDLFDVLSQAHRYIASTPLTSLTFVECNISTKALSVILSLPKALQELTIGERIYHFRESPTEPLLINPNTFMAALSQQKHSLESFKHVAMDNRLPRNIDAYYQKFLSFEKVRILDAGFISLLYGLPKSLEILRLEDLSNYPEFEPLCRLNWAALRSQIQRGVLPKACHVEIYLVHRLLSIDSPVSTPELYSQSDKREAVYDLAELLIERGSQLRIYSDYFPGGTSYIPPYLYGEEEPQQEKVYDSQQFYYFCGTNYQSQDDEDYGREPDQALGSSPLSTSEGSSDTHPATAADEQSQDHPQS